MATTERVRLIATDVMKSQARDVQDLLDDTSGSLTVERSDDRHTALPAELNQAIQKVIEVMASGGTVTISALPEEVTTSTAAKMLGLSRPTVMKMIREGELPASKVGTHHRLLSTDVLAEVKRRRARERAAFEKLRDMDI